MVIRTYNDWYLAHKEALAEKIRRDDHTEGEKLTAEIVRYSHLKNHLLAEEHEAADIIIACDDAGEGLFCRASGDQPALWRRRQGRGGRSPSGSLV